MMKMKNFSRSSIAVAMMGCYLGAAASTAVATPVALASASFSSKANELPVLRTYNSASNASGEFAATLLTPTQTELLIFSESAGSVGTPVTVPLTGGGAPSGLAVDADGDVAVAWNEVVGSNYYPFFGNATITNTVYVQRFGSDGTAKGDPIQVAKQIAGDVISSTAGGPETLKATSFSQPQVAMDDEGDIAVGWSQVTTKCAVLNFSANGYCYGTTGSESSQTYAALYNSANGVTVATSVVDSLAFGTASQGGYGHANLLMGMRMSGSGNLVMLLDAARDTTAGVYAHLFGPGLASKGASFKLSGVKPTYPQYLASTVGDQVNLEHAKGKYLMPAQVFGGSNEPSFLSAFGVDSAGNFDVAWVDGTDYSLYVTRYDSSGNVRGKVIGPIASLDTTTNGTCGATVGPAGGDFQLAVAPGGSFAVTWGEAMPYTGAAKAYATCSMEKHAQFYQADGTANGASVVVDAGADATFNPAASLSTMDGNGNLLTLWNSIGIVRLTSTDSLDALLIPAP